MASWQCITNGWSGGERHVYKCCQGCGTVSRRRARSSGGAEESDVPWSDCVHEDRGDGALVVVPPTIPVAGLVIIPDRLRILVRRHNHVSCDAAHVQLRVAMHIGPVHYDGHGFVGHDVSLLFRLLDARPLRRMLSESGAEVAFIASGNIYEHVIRRRPSLVDLALFQRLLVRVKETRTRAWACALGALPEAARTSNVLRRPLTAPVGPPVGPGFP